MTEHVPAAAKGLSKITRRIFLRNSTAAVAGVAGATIAVPAEAAAPSAKERFDFHLAELRKAAEEIDPLIGRWNICRAEDGDDELGNCPLVISAHRITGRYEGDGTYEGGYETVFGRRINYQVRLLPERVEGHRTFSVRTSMDRMVLPEPRLNCFIGRKISQFQIERSS